MGITIESGGADSRIFIIGCNARPVSNVAAFLDHVTAKLHWKEDIELTVSEDR